MKVLPYLIASCVLSLSSYTELHSQKKESLSVGSRQREYYLHLPSSYNTSMKSMPLVIGLHGANQDAYETKLSFAAMTGFDHFSDSLDFIVVYPVGIGSDVVSIPTWNAGKCCPPASTSNIPDVEFISAMIDTLALRYWVDTKRVYATGFSNGAIMCYRLACELSTKIAAVAPHSGAYMMDGACIPQRPVPLLHIHSRLDSVLPFNGGAGKLNSTFLFPSVDSSISIWRGVIGCPELPEIIFTSNLATGFRWSPCAKQAQVQLYSTEDGRHWWTGSPVSVGSKAFSATALIWDFFKQYTLPEDPSSTADDPNPIQVQLVFPNPAKEFFELQFVNPSDELLRLVIVNELGEVAQTIFDGMLTSGRYAFRVQTSGLGTGMYGIHVLSHHLNRIGNVIIIR